jgi:hypothetical protein
MARPWNVSLPRCVPTIGARNAPGQVAGDNQMSQSAAIRPRLMAC